jgi:hypothetical protein
MWYYNYYIAALILSLIYFIISRQSLSILISIIIIIIISYFYINRITVYDNENKTNFKNKIVKLNNDIQYRQYINDNNYYLKKFPNEIKYLINDKTLLDIVLNIRYTKRYDLEKYTNIIFHIDKLYKIYMFILSNRYDINKYFDIFIDLRNMIIREMYSIYVILPVEMKYYYGFNSFDELKKSIDTFINYSRNMIKIIERYGYQEKGVYYLKDTKYKPYENNNKNDVF